MNFNMYAPTRVLFGAGELGNLHQQDMPGKKAMVVISSGTSTRKYGYLDRLEEQLRQANIDFLLFDQVESNPLKTTVESGANLAREGGCEFIIALGGGSRNRCGESYGHECYKPLRPLGLCAQWQWEGAAGEECRPASSRHHHYCRDGLGGRCLWRYH